MRAHCPHCEDLEHELAYYRSEVEIVDDMDATRKLKERLGVQGDTEARILLHLSRCRHNTATKLQLHDLLNSEETGSKAVDVFICRLRKKLTFEAIETLWGAGYRLTPLGLEQVRAALA